MSGEDKFKFRLCLELGVPHPRYLDMFLTRGDLEQWAGFLSWYYKQGGNE